MGWVTLTITDVALSVRHAGLICTVQGQVVNRSSSGPANVQAVSNFDWLNVHDRAETAVYCSEANNDRLIHTYLHDAKMEFSFLPLHARMQPS